MAADLHVLAPRDNRTVENTLEGAQNDNLVELLAIGTDIDGDFVYRDSGLSRRDALWLIEKAREWVMRGD